MALYQIKVFVSSIIIIFCRLFFRDPDIISSYVLYKSYYEFGLEFILISL